MAKRPTAAVNDEWETIPAPQASSGDEWETVGVPAAIWAGGVAPPSYPSVKLPAELRAPTTAPSGYGMSTRNPRTGRQYTEQDVTARVPVIDAPTEGVKQIGEGIPAMADPSLERKAHGASQVIRGAMGVATPLLPGAAVAVPVRVAAGLGAGMLAGNATEGGLKAAGVPEGYSELAGDVAGIAAGGKAAKVASPENIAGAKLAIRKKVDIAYRNPELTMVKAVKPKATNVNFTESLDRSMPELKATEAQTGKPITGVDDLIDTRAEDGSVVPGAITLAKRRIWGQIEQMAGPQRAMGSTIDGTPIADSIVASIPKALELENPQTAAAIRNTADAYRRRFTLDEAETLLREKNATLDAYYSKYPTAQRRALASNPDTATDYATAEALRKSIYGLLDQPGQGAAAVELKRRYGSLLNLEEEAYRRRNVAMRQVPDSLSEQVSKWAAAGHGLRGIAKLLTLQPSGLVDIAQGLGERQIAKWVKEQNTTDSLIRRAMAAYDKTPTPVDVPPTPKPKALLPEPIGLEEGKPGLSGNPTGGTIYTPEPKDTSGMVPPVGYNAPYVKPMPQIPGPSSPIPQGGFSTSGSNYDLVPYKNPTTGMIEYVPKWMLGNQEPLTGGHPALSLPQ